MLTKVLFIGGILLASIGLGLTYFKRRSKFDNISMIIYLIGIIMLLAGSFMFVFEIN